MHKLAPLVVVALAATLFSCSGAPAGEPQTEIEGATSVHHDNRLRPRHRFLRFQSRAERRVVESGRAPSGPRDLLRFRLHAVTEHVSIRLPMRRRIRVPRKAREEA